MTLSAGEVERLNTWAREITGALLPPETQTRRDGPWLRFLGQGGLVVHQSGYWWWHSHNIGGHATLRLIQELGVYNSQGAISWAKCWLAEHIGSGSCTLSGDIEEGHPALAADAADMLSRLEDPAGSIVQEYLESRQIAPPFPACVKILRNARVGEDALAMILEAKERITGLELTYLDATGAKSTVEPKRRTFKAERSPDAIFNIPSPGANKDVIVAEGALDALTIFRWAGYRTRVVGTPGIGALRHLRFPDAEKITVVAQGDAPGSPAAKALQEGLDALILAGGDVYVTETPPIGEDANSILQKAGVDGLRTFLDSAKPAKLSLNGEIEKLSRLPELDYAQIRKAEAKRLGIQVKLLDDEVRKHRAANAASPPGSDWDDVSTADIEHETVDLADTLDGIVKELRRYVVAPDSAFVTIALWCAHAHLVHHKLIKLTVSPRLGIQAADYGSGKTVTLECVTCLVPTPITASNITASSLFRSIALEHPTLMLDEVHLLLHSKRDPELLQIMNASHRRKSAKIRTSEPLPNGGWQAVEYDVWHTSALASVGELPRDQQERSVIVSLPKALGEDVQEHLEDGTSPELEQLYTKLVVWAAGQEELPRPALPDPLRRQHGRIGDNWRPLLSVAEAAGKHWPKLALDAALAAINSEKQLTPTQRLLLSIRKAFGTFDPPTPGDALQTGELLYRLINDTDEEWSRENRGRPISAYWLRNNLRGLLDPAGAREWWSGPENKRVHHRGYYRHQFQAAWRSHLAGIQENISSDPPAASGASGASGEVVDISLFFETPAGAGECASGAAYNASTAAPDAQIAAPDNETKTSTKSKAALDAPDAPDVREGSGEKKSENGGPLPNGEERLPRRRYRRRGDLARDIREFAAEHSALTPEQIGKKFGVSRPRVERILGAGA
jgi:hypothetical protein